MPLLQEGIVREIITVAHFKTSDVMRVQNTASILITFNRSTASEDGKIPHFNDSMNLIGIELSHTLV
jgi:hypothetical protein